LRVMTTWTHLRDRHADPERRASQVRYEILVEGILDERWSSWFDGLELSDRPGDLTLLTGSLPDQAAPARRPSQNPRPGLAAGLAAKTR
jgi:hypothetical protein